MPPLPYDLGVRFSRPLCPQPWWCVLASDPGSLSWDGRESISLSQVHRARWSESQVPSGLRPAWNRPCVPCIPHFGPQSP